MSHDARTGEEIRELVAGISKLLEEADFNTAMGALVNSLAIGLILFADDLERDLGATHRFLDVAVQLHLKHSDSETMQ